ncbi:MAG: LacI family transcriptional regulator [Betaproteobacteria bacterium]|nr:LacI family transcriptional regulator [Betaproteobacteria bacterium]
MRMLVARTILAVVAVFFGAACAAQGYPARAVRMIVPFAPGGGTDILVRTITPRVAESLGQQLVIDNRAGGGSTIGTELAAKSAPDGYTLLSVDSAFTTNPSLYSKLPYDTTRDFSPVSLLASAPVILIVHPSVPVKTVKEFVALAKAKPGQLNFASGGPGSSTHLGGELLKLVANIDLVHIPYKGTGPAVADVLGGQVVMMFAGISSVKQHVAVGRLRAIAVTGDRRSPAMPEVPTFIESGLKGVDSGTYWGCLAPAQTPRDIVNKLSSTIAGVLKLSDIQQRLIDLGFDPIGGTPEQFAANIKSETEKWARVIRNANVKLD